MQLTQLGARHNVIQPVYNEAKLLERLHVWLDRPTEPDGLLDPAIVPPSPVGVSGIDYDALGQRTSIAYANGARTTYAYDPQTLRLRHLLTERPVTAFPDDCPQPRPPDSPGCQVQNLSYTYDPVGNITSVRDDAQQTVFFRNKRVEPTADYTYDAVYRLIEASGREHLGHTGGSPTPGSYNDVPRIGLPLSAGDGTALGRYLERYFYDSAGNVTQLAHRGSDPASPGWTRGYAYTEPSQLEPGRSSNRLSATTIGATTDRYSSGGDGYDAHGNLLRMPQLQVMTWDYRDQLAMSQRQAVNADGDGVLHQGERTYYVCDAAGHRTRKVTERPNGTRKQERRYLGGLEVFRAYSGSGDTIELERETLHVMDDRQRIALVETHNAGDDGSSVRLIRYQFGNHLGSVGLELNEQAQLISYEEYYPYGGTAYQAGRSAVEVNLKRYRFSGMERDEESGLSHHGARYYASWLGRWTSADPIGLSADGLNLYAYVADNPVGQIDPSGLEGENPEKGAHQWGADHKDNGDRHERLMDLNKLLFVHPAEKSFLTHVLGLQGDDKVLAHYGYKPPRGSTKRADFNLTVRMAIMNYDSDWQANEGHPYRSTMSAPSAEQNAYEASKAFVKSIVEAHAYATSSLGGALAGGIPFAITGDATLAAQAGAIGDSAAAAFLAYGQAKSNRGSYSPGVENEPYAATKARAEANSAGRAARLAATKLANRAVLDSIKDVNPTGDPANCTMVVDAVSSTLSGRPMQAGVGPMVPAHLMGQKYPALRPMSLKAAVAAMKAGGPGAQGVLVGWWHANGSSTPVAGHVINLYNSRGTILVLDGQFSGIAKVKANGHYLGNLHFSRVP